MNDLKNAVPCVASYMLFDPSDEVMKNNVAYYQFHREKWGLEDEDFLPRAVRERHHLIFNFMWRYHFAWGSDACVCVSQEALRYYNQTTMQLQMLEFSRQRLQGDDEVCYCVCVCVCVCVFM